MQALVLQRKTSHKLNPFALCLELIAVDSFSFTQATHRFFSPTYTVFLQLYTCYGGHAARSVAKIPINNKHILFNKPKQLKWPSPVKLEIFPGSGEL